MGKLSGWEKFFYYIYVIATFGGVWIAKIIIKKAIIEAYEKNTK